MRAVRSPKDFYTGLMYAAFGGAVLWIGRDYALGSATQMGLGYFPKLLATILIGIGGVLLARSFRSEGEPVGRLAVRSLTIVTVAICTAAWLLPRAGLLVSLFVLCLVSATASREFRLELKSLAGLILLVALSALVFARALGMPMPILGTWLEPLLGPVLSQIFSPVIESSFAAIKAVFAAVLALFKLLGLR